MARPKDLERKKEILTSTLKVFRKHGGWDLSLNEIARQLRTSTRMLVHHFETKENLIKECKRSLEDRLHHELSSAPPQKNWKKSVCDVWAASLERPYRDDRRLRLMSNLQSPQKNQNNKDNEQVIRSLRELLPSRLQKFAEDVFIYASGLELYVLSGGTPERAIKNLQHYLQRLENQAPRSPTGGPFGPRQKISSNI